MKFIEVSSSSDFGALGFEESEWFNEKGRLFSLAQTHKDNKFQIYLDKELGVVEKQKVANEPILTIKALEFEVIDFRFIQYTQNLYKKTKESQYTNFYRVEE